MNPGVITIQRAVKIAGLLIGIIEVARRTVAELQNAVFAQWLRIRDIGRNGIAVGIGSALLVQESAGIIICKKLVGGIQVIGTVFIIQRKAGI